MADRNFQDFQDPTDRLAALASGPVPLLAPADAVRARGEQRQRTARTTVGLMGAAVILAAGAAFGLTSGGDPDSLQPPPVAVSPSADPSPTDATPTTPAATASPKPVPVPPEALLTAPEAQRVAGGTWTENDHVEESFPLLFVCADGGEGGVSGLRRSIEGPGTQSVLSQVVRYPSSAEDVVDRLVADVGRCPSRPEDAEPPATATVRHEVLESDSNSAVVRRTSRECDPTCTESSSLWLVVQVDDLASYLALGSAERSRVGAWEAAVRDRLTACAQSECPGTSRSRLTATDVLTATGIGPVRVGDRLQVAVRAAGQPFTPFVDELGNDCGFVAPRSETPDISLMVVKGEVVRIDVDGGSTTRTAEGIALGDTLAAVRAAYGDRVRVEQNPYTFEEVLVVPEPDGVHGLLFDSDGRVITSMRGGELSALRGFEGCA